MFKFIQNNTFNNFLLSITIMIHTRICFKCIHIENCTLKMRGLYLYTLKISLKSCNMLRILNNLTQQKKLHNLVTNNVFSKFTLKYFEQLLVVMFFIYFLTPRHQLLFDLIYRKSCLTQAILICQTITTLQRPRTGELHGEICKIYVRDV